MKSSRVVLTLAVHSANLAGLSAQTVVRAPARTLSGVVQDSATGQPVGFAQLTIMGTDQQVFTSVSGRFTLRNVAPGKANLRIQQIGYRALTLAITIDTLTRAGENAPRLVVRLTRQAVILPELSVDGKTCLDLHDVGSSAPEGRTILTEAFANAERILTLERKYPFVLEFQRLVTVMDSDYNTIEGHVDSLRKDSRDYVPYRAGKVLERVFGREHLASFTTSDFAGKEFQQTHCFSYAGRDSLEGFSGYRIDFVPKPEITSPDWAGSMLVDSTSLDLLRTETRLVNLPRRGTNFRTASCVIFYQPIVPGLPQEFQVRCVTSQRGGRTPILLERWLLTGHRFVGRVPDALDRP
jgi:hypothetical protein